MSMAKLPRPKLPRQRSEKERELEAVRELSYERFLQDLSERTHHPIPPELFTEATSHVLLKAFASALGEAIRAGDAGSASEIYTLLGEYIAARTAKPYGTVTVSHVGSLITGVRAPGGLRIVFHEYTESGPHFDAKGRAFRQTSWTKP